MAIPAEQAAAAAQLERRAGAAAIETHISAVFVGADTVWKLRKAVRLGFLDFTRLAERERCSRREVALSAASAPGLYAGVEALHDDAGAVIDWVVRMARVPEGDLLDAIAATGRLTPRLLDEVADAVAADHARRPVRLRDQAAALAGVVAGNAASARAAGLAPDRVDAWQEGMTAALGRLAGRLDRRARGGFVRRAHGDLHLGNVCLWRGRPALFDPLEFDDDLATIDVAYDLAFLLMDLERRAGRPAANRVLNRTVARTGDAALAPLLPPLLSMRAMIRAHVAAAQGRGPEAAALLAQAEAMLVPAEAVVLAIGGLPGTGKSTLARALAPDLGPAPGALVLRSDEIRKRRHGAALERRLPAVAYTPAASAAVHAELAAMTRAAAGHAVIADATFMDPDVRATVAAAATPARFLGVWLHADAAELERRVEARTGDASDAGLDVVRRALADDPGPGAWLPVDATDAGAAEAAVREALRGLGALC